MILFFKYIYHRVASVIYDQTTIIYNVNYLSSVLLCCLFFNMMDNLQFSFSPSFLITCPTPSFLEYQLHKGRVYFSSLLINLQSLALFMTFVGCKERKEIKMKGGIEEEGKKESVQGAD